MHDDQHATHHDGRAGLGSLSFWGLIGTQMFGAFNDNMFRWLVVPIAKEKVGGDMALSVGAACFTLPYLLLATHAGWLADRFSKRTVIVFSKVAEIVILVLGLGALALGSPVLLFVTVGLLGAQAALYGPAKYGSLPEILKSEKLSAGNGVMGLVTILSSAGGVVAGYALYESTKPAASGGGLRLGMASVALIGVAVAGWIASLLVRTSRPGDSTLRCSVNPFSGTWGQLQSLGSNKPLLRTALGIAFFWTLASLANLNIDVFGKDVLQLEAGSVGQLLGVLVLGVGFGSVLAGWWSGGKVELGIVPLGAAGIAVGAIALFFTGHAVDGPATTAAAMTHAYHSTFGWLFLLGAGAGLFNVPLDTFLQHRSPAATRGSILAASNFITFSGILLSSGLFYVLRRGAGLEPEHIFLVAGLGTIPVVLYAFFLLPQATIRFIVWFLSHSVYRVRVMGRENLPETGGALLVANHVTWVDGILLLISSSRPIRMLAYSDYVKGFGIGWLTRTMGVIPIKGSEGPKALLRSLATAKEAIQAGDLVCIFAEGQLTRTGQLQAFQRGLLRIVEGTGAPVIPVYLDGLWGSIFSYHGGRYFWKWPRKWPYPVSILFGQPLPEPDDVNLVRRAVEGLGVEAVDQRKHREKILPRLFLRRCRKNFSRAKVADSTGAELTGGQLLLKTLVVRRILNRLLGADEKMVGVLLPPSVGGVLVNAALPLLGRVPVNLNYTVSNDVLNSCIDQCQIKHVLTSKKFMEKVPFKIPVEVVYLEDFAKLVTGLDKAIAAVQAFATPCAVLDQLFGLTRISPDDLLTIIFTSGSTGEPKGVMLSMYNVYSNIEAIDQLLHLKPTDVLFGILPFFHSFGFTATMWTMLALDPKAVYHFNPLDARVIGELSQKHKATILMATPTFLRGYIKRVEKEQFATLDMVVTGAEKLPQDLAQAFQDKFGFRPSEGYGTTELSPLASVNIPDHRSITAGQEIHQKGTKEGTVGRAVPGVAAKVVDPDTFADLGIETPGLLLIKGPNVMQGYLNKPELTAKVIRDGWYITGDIAKIDSDGFITITDRLSRFSKIGGEMVPHMKVEELLSRILSNGSEDPELKAVVTSVPDPKKGERLIVVHKPFADGQSPDQIVKGLAAAGLPNLWIPSSDSFLQVDEIPVLGTGKLDLKGLKSLALARFAGPN
ncbi:MAG: MFS transporter [Planctomycetales bacterium]|nr:MFS transporter [Planctomycetales bacterium]